MVYAAEGKRVSTIVSSYDRPSIWGPVVYCELPILYICLSSLTYIEDITRWWEDMNFMFEWQEQYLTSERSEQVEYKKIKHTAVINILKTFIL